MYIEFMKKVAYAQNSWFPAYSTTSIYAVEVLYLYRV